MPGTEGGSVGSSRIGLPTASCSTASDASSSNPKQAGRKSASASPANRRSSSAIGGRLSIKSSTRAMFTARNSLGLLRNLSSAGMCR